MIEMFLIVSSMEPYATAEIVNRLVRKGVLIHHILYVEEKFFADNNVEDIEDSLCPYLKRRDLDYVEIQIVDYCNLNCESCLHYAPLVRKQSIADYDEIYSGLEKLSSFYNIIKNVRLMGGEPLLNPELGKYVSSIRKLLPQSNIYVVTNGLLIKNLSDELLNCIRQNGVVMDISYYPVMKDEMDEVRVFLKEKHVEYRISEMITHFRKIGKLTENNIEQTEDTFRKCPSKMSTCISGGKISPCFLPFVTKYFNDYYNFSLPTNDYLDLNTEGIDVEAINLFLEKRLERCKFCTVEWKNHETEWRTVQGDKVPLTAYIY